jgi:hypothetical protein
MQNQRRAQNPRSRPRAGMRRFPILGNRANINRSARNGRSRNQNGASHFDGWTQSRTINIAKTIHTINTADDVAFGIGNVKFVPTVTDQPFLNSILNEAADMYEQYRIRRVRIYATPGKNFTNDIRIKTKVLARVDRDNFKPYSSANALGVLSSSSNTVTKLLPDCAKVLLCDFNPVCKPYLPGQSTSDGRQLPPTLSWMALRDVNSNKRFSYDEWLGATIGLVTPDESYQPTTSPTIALTIRLDIQFRGRIFNTVSYSSSSITLTKPSEITGSMSDMKNSFLTGAYHPLDGFATINVANIGTDLSINALGYKFRINATNIIYVVDAWDNATLTWGASEE